MNSDNEIDKNQESAAYFEGDSSIESVENESQFKCHYEEIKRMLPPPIPLLPKTFKPSEPIFQSQNIPFKTFPVLVTEQQLEPIGASVDKSLFPAKFSQETTLQSLFCSKDLVYIRNRELVTENFNLNICNVRKLMEKRKLREKNERNYENPLLVEELDTYYKLQDSTLIFESRFESGNLALASKVNDSEYNLLLQTDINSKGHTQWFYFSVKNTNRGPVKFNIVNFAKSDSLHNKGMKILVCSEKLSKSTGQGWFRGGENIMYYPNGITKNISGKCFSTLTFTHCFDFSRDTVYFAYSLPYLYSQLQNLLDSYEKSPERSKFIHRKVLCRSLGGNNCDYLTITNKGTLEEIRCKKAVIISARVHPGETVGSWMMQGVLDFLTSEDLEANDLRNKYIFKVVPMLNPDGVINGNYRCSLIGADLNRRWKSPKSSMHPVIHQFKRLIHSTAANYEIDLICDLHGHSRKKNVFMYGCHLPASPHACKLFPFVLSKVSGIFSFSDSRFGIHKSKESTMRVTMFNEIKIPNVFTLEASFCGADSGKYKNFHFTAEILAEMGKDLCRALLVVSQNSGICSNPTPKKPLFKNASSIIIRKSDSVPTLQITKVFQVESIFKELLEKKDIVQCTSSSGSDSDPSEDNLEYSELKKLLPVTNSTKKKTLPAKKKIEISRNLHLPKSRTVVKKKCPRCGEEEVFGHSCKIEAPPPPMRKRMIGIKTYYNLLGKKVHDQATQTPPAFYPKATIRRKVSGFNAFTPDYLQEYSANVSGNDEPGFLSDTPKSKLPSFRIYKKQANSSGHLTLRKVSRGSQSCTSCQVAMTTFQVWASSSSNSKRISSMITSMCSSTWAPNNCDLILTALIPELDLALQQNFFNPDRFCAVLGACSSPIFTHENFTEWENSVLQGSPEYFVPTTGQDYFNFAQLSDIHLDNNYVIGSASECSNIPCCRGAVAVGNAAGRWGNYNCDLPQGTLNAAVDFLAAQDLDFIIWTGDTPAHNMQLNLTQKIASVQSVTSLLWAKFSNVVPVYPIFGNEEGHIDHQYNFVGTNPLNSALASLWAPWIGATAAASLKAFGRYSLMHRNTNLKIVAVNTQACDQLNFWLLSNVTDPGGNIAFLRSELESAEANDQYVYIIGHIPPASDTCLTLWSKHYEVLVQRYKNIIRGQFFGHLHTDEIRISKDQNSDPIGLQFISPALDPLNYINPSFRIYKADFLSKSVKTYYQYRMDLTSVAPVFYQAYEFLSYYIVKDMFPATIYTLATTMQNDEMIAMKYISNKFTASPATPVGCDAQCQSDNFCDITNDRPDTIRKCKGLLQSPADYWLQKLYGQWIYKHS